MLWDVFWPSLLFPLDLWRLESLCPPPALLRSLFPRLPLALWLRQRGRLLSFPCCYVCIGTLPADFGFDPLGLMDPEGEGGFITPAWLSYSEVIHSRWAMLGAAGIIAPEILASAGVIPQSPEEVLWWKTGLIPPLGTYKYWTDPWSLFLIEVSSSHQLCASRDNGEEQSQPSHVPESGMACGSFRCLRDVGQRRCNCGGICLL
jgi:Chlorophyll A-B binding protein